MTVALISALANWIGDTILYPVDTISTRLKASKYTNHSAFTFIITSIRNDKFKLFKGVQLTFPAAFIPTFVYITIYDTLMKSIDRLLAKYKINE